MATSRFFHGGLSDSESSSSEEDYSEEEEELEEDVQNDSDESESTEDDDDDNSDDDDEEEEELEDGNAPDSQKKNIFTRDVVDEEDSDEDGLRRIVKNKKDKRFEEIETSIRLIENAEKINDWVVISQEFDKLNKLATKAGHGDVVPKPYIKAVADLEDFMNETLLKEKAASKKMNATNAKALNSIKQRLKRNNRQHEQDISQYRADKENYLLEPEVEDIPVPLKPTFEGVEPERVDDDSGAYSVVTRGGKAVQLTKESIFKHLKVIIEARGKKNTDRTEQIRTMEKLLELAQTPYQKIRVLVALISTRYDLSSGVLSYMATDQWKAAEIELNTLLQVLEENPSWIIIENGDEWDDDEKSPPTPAPGEIFKISGSIISFVDRLDDELTKSLQNIDPHTTEYVERLGDEAALYKIIVRSQMYFERLSSNKNAGTIGDSLNRTVMRRVEHLYYKPLAVIETIEEASYTLLTSESSSDVLRSDLKKENPATIVQNLCSHLYKNDSTILRTRAMLCHIYHLALRENFYKSRDMFLMSHLQENIHNADITTQILYNRTLVQVGLCAFRNSLISEAQSCLQEILGSGRVKEHLAQGVGPQSRYSTITPEQERLEKQRQLPFHMHINLELLEAAYLTCSMLLEIPAMAAAGSSPDMRKRVISKTFRRMLEFHERNVFPGPPENTRDHVFQAANALAAGDWKKSCDLIQAIKIWDLLPNSESLKEMLSVRIQEEGLRTYIFTYAPFYDALSLTRLSEMFDLAERKVSALVSKMIAHDEIAAALDQINKTLVFRKGVEVSRLQTLALALSDKASGLIELNERVFEQKAQSGAVGGLQENTTRPGGGGRGKPRGEFSGNSGGGNRGRGGGRGRGGRNVQFAGERSSAK
ncbi:Translation initiation factor 3 subunit c [Orbilia oligospora]|nr:Translation initiation factor 3 subunit c [Orbilia oligospora]KAF3235743.1 Translation initiation factor 3 subunit c [Orbilia oligospora]KAF3239113.1 Translation initiation factor 3 subunit c [Orbilia oligospora]KAF3275503.1 Translation initiation factor 3 subunit c [Orbilia oligospora]